MKKVLPLVLSGVVLGCAVAYAQTNAGKEKCARLRDKFDAWRNGFIAREDDDEDGDCYDSDDNFTEF